MTVIAPSMPTALFTVPYLTIDEYKRAPTGVDLHGLSGSSAAQRDAELANIVARASGCVNTICMQNLAATVDTEQGRVRSSRTGEIYVSTHCWPIIEVRSLLLGSQPSNMTATDLTECFITDSGFTVARASLGLSTTQGPLQLPAISRTGQAFAKWTYVNGWPCTHTTTTTTAGGTSLHLFDTTGVHIGTSLTIYDAEFTETVTITGEPVAGVVACSAMAFNHGTVGVNVSSLPPTIKDATILLVSALVKSRGNQALVMKSVNSREPEAQAKSGSGQADVNSAKWMLSPFRAIR